MSSYVAAAGEFTRDTNYIATRITADGRDGYPVEPGRYRLIVARACPWANRAIIVRRLLGLESVISIGFCGPTHDKRSWTFDLDPGGVDPVLKVPRLQDAYFKRFPDYPKGMGRFMGHAKVATTLTIYSHLFRSNHTEHMPPWTR
jgi:glutathionyl-hydroquinone reductase